MNPVKGEQLYTKLAQSVTGRGSGGSEGGGCLGSEAGGVGPTPPSFQRLGFVALGAGFQASRRPPRTTTVFFFFTLAGQTTRFEPSTADGMHRREFRCGCYPPPPLTLSLQAAPDSACAAAARRRCSP